jgi:hypothetical protein
MVWSPQVRRVARGVGATVWLLVIGVLRGLDLLHIKRYDPRQTSCVMAPSLTATVGGEMAPWDWEG